MSIILHIARFMEPLHSGKYPDVMVNKVGKRLPKFPRRQYLMVKGSYDFIGLNYYTAYYAANIPCQQNNPTLLTDSCTTYTRKLLYILTLLISYFHCVLILFSFPGTLADP